MVIYRMLRLIKLIIMYWEVFTIIISIAKAAVICNNSYNSSSSSKTNFSNRDIRW